MLRKQGVTWDGIPIPYVTAEDLSEKAIATFISKAEKKGRLDSDLRQESKEELVRKLNLVSNAYLTNAAVTWFFLITMIIRSQDLCEKMAWIKMKQCKFATKC